MLLLVSIASLILGGPALALYKPCGDIDRQGMDPFAFWASCTEAVATANCDCPDGESCCPSVVDNDGDKSCQIKCKAPVPQSEGSSETSDLKCPELEIEIVAPTITSDFNRYPELPELPEETDYLEWEKSCGGRPQCENCTDDQMCCKTTEDNQCAWGCATPVKKTNWEACPQLKNIDDSTFWKSCPEWWGRGYKCEECADDQLCCTKKTDSGNCTYECATKLDINPKSGSCPSADYADWLKMNKIYCDLAKNKGLVEESECRHDGDCKGNRKCCSPVIADDEPTHAKCRRACYTPVGDNEEDEEMTEM